MKRIYFDIDGVLANYVDALLHKLYADTGISVPYSAIAQYNTKRAVHLFLQDDYLATAKLEAVNASLLSGLLGFDGFYLSLQPYQEVLSAVHRLKEKYAKNSDPISFLTARGTGRHFAMRRRSRSHDVQIQTKDWLLKWRLTEHDHACPLAFCSDKAEHLLRLGGSLLLVEDNNDTALAAARAGIYVLLIERPWNIMGGTPMLMHVKEHEVYDHCVAFMEGE